MPAGPWASLPENIVTDRIGALMNATAEQISAIRPPIPNIGKVASPFGYARRELTIYEVLKVDEVYPGPKADALSARPSFTATTVPGFSAW